MPISIISFFLLIPILFWAFFTWDNLIKLEHEKFLRQWLDDGKPTGIFWHSAKSRRTYRSGMVTQKYMFIWLFKNPEWVKASDEALILIKRYRTLVFTWNISIILWFFVGLRIFREV
jgi:hypothetical protein